MKSLPSGTVTFLFTDIEGSTKLAQNYRDQWETMRARHHAILHQAMQAHNGHVFQIVGDEFCVAFHAAIDAVRSAADAQRMLHTEPWEPVPIKVRMGIHSGTANIADVNDPSSGYTGYIALARVARLRSAGHGGQVLVSLATEELVRDELPEEMSLRDMGARRLKDLNRPEQIFQLILPNLPTDFPPLKTLDAYRHNLPTQMTTFIGREREMAEVKHAIDDHRLVTLTGAGGTGKTRLALQVAADLLDQYPDGIWFVELASLTDPQLIPQSILSACGVPEQKGLTSLQTLQDYLRDRQLLLILDNCEHIIEASASLAETLLNHTHGLKIIATTREPLGVTGEADWVVPSLSLPDTKHAIIIEQISQYEAVQLFIDRTLLIRPHFNVTKDNAPAIAQICHRLDGIPLALELAAARVRSLSVDEIAARLDDRFRLLTGGSRTALPRQQTLRATIDWSYNLLSQQEKSLLRRLSVFAGGWTLEAAEQVCCDGESEADILDLLTHLVDKSLVMVEETSGRSRYHLIETTRQYAREKLFDLEEASGIRDHHLAYFLGLAEKAEANIHGPHQAEWMERLENDHDNFRAALDWCISERQTKFALRLLFALGWTWALRSHSSEMNDWFEKVCALPDISDYPARYVRLLLTMLFHCYLLSIRDPQPLLEECQKIYSKLGTTGEGILARILLNQGMFASFQEGSETAKRLLGQSIELFQKVGDRRGEAEALINLGFVALDEGDITQVLFFCEQSLAIFRQTGNLWGCGRSLRALARLYLVQGDYERTLSYSKQQIEIDEKLQYKLGMCFGYFDLGDLHRFQGELDVAEQWYDRGWMLGHECGFKHPVATYYLCKGLIAFQRNDFHLAWQYVRDQFTFSKRNGLPLDYMYCFFVAALAATSGKPESAARLYGAVQVAQPQRQMTQPFPEPADKSFGMAQGSENDLRPSDHAAFERCVKTARDQLGDTAFDALVMEGRTATLEQVVEQAINTVEER